jgi:primosomal protein N' (replication factor Y)
MSKTAASDRALVAEVAVIPPIAGHEVLSYAIPTELAPSIGPGQRVLVPLAQRQVTGIVIAVDDGRDLPGVRLREVLDVLDTEPLLSSELLALCRFAARYYMASLGEVLATAVLAGLRAETRRTVRRGPGSAAASQAPLGRIEREILARLPAERPVRTSAIARVVRSSAFYEALRSLAARGVVVVEEHAARAAANVRFARIATAARDPSEAEQVEIERRARAQWRLLIRIREAAVRGIDTADLDAKEVAPLRALVGRGLVRVDRREVYRSIGGKVPAPSRALVANSGQRRAIEAIDEAAKAGRFETFLLRGVTGSGKTEVYLQAAAQVLEAGRGVLILVPEIALTPDLVDRVCSRFGASVAVLHSGLSDGERFDEWRRLARGEARIAVGVRSAVFAPVRRLGLVVVDEEHDVAYKQEDGLRYNARDLAIVRARDSHCPAVLGSATPSIESHHNAVTERYRLLELAERVERRPMPAVEVIDLKIERPEGDPPVLSPRLRDAIVANFAAGGQTLVFLNRRGYAHYLQCTLCGHVLACPNCSVTLTFHLRAGRARCHHCDYSVAAPELCPECRSPHLRDFGIGTEQVEAVLAALLPRARIARMDRDTVARKGALADLLEAWRSRRFDVLVGTQMITKGHDVAGVTLVGVVAPDQTLNFPDFRAAERTFQMLTQVAGRAGRGDQPGRVLIQTYRPTHYAIRFALSHDFTGFATEEIRYREALGYPPFSRLLNVRFDGLDGARVERTARAAAAELRAANESAPRARRVAILGPATAPLEKLRSRYRWQMLLKARETRLLHELTRPLLGARGDNVHDRAVRVTADVDPYGML